MPGGYSKCKFQPLKMAFIDFGGGQKAFAIKIECTKMANYNLVFGIFAISHHTTG